MNTVMDVNVILLAASAASLLACGAALAVRRDRAAFAFAVTGVAALALLLGIH